MKLRHLTGEQVQILERIRETPKITRAALEALETSMAEQIAFVLGELAMHNLVVVSGYDGDASFELTAWGHRVLMAAELLEVELARAQSDEWMPATRVTFR